jgi:CHAT domain-containing protein
MCDTDLSAQSYNDRISEARSSNNYTTQEQITNLLELREELQHQVYKDTLGTVEYFLAMRYRRLSNHEKIIEHATQAIEAYKQSDYSGYRVSFCYTIRCLANNQLGKQKEAMSDALAIESLELNGRGFEALGDAIKFQAATYRNNGDFESSINKLNNFFITDNADSLNNYFRSNLYLELSMAYSNYEDSTSLYRAIEAIDSVNTLIPNIDNQFLYKDKTEVLALSQLGHIYSQFEDWKTAINYYEQALEIANLISLDHETNRFRMLAKVNLIELYGKTGQSNRMKRFEGEESELYLDVNQPVYAAYYENLATQYRKNGELQTAVEYINKAKEVLHHPEDQLQIQKHKQRLSTVLLEEVEIYFSYYSETGNKRHITQAANTMGTLDTLIDLIGLDLLFESSVFKWRESAKAFYDAGLKVSFATQNINLFWRYAEKTKGLALLEIIIRNQRENRSPEYEAVNNKLFSLRKLESEISNELLSPDINKRNKADLEKKLIQNKNEQLKLYVEEQKRLRKIIPDVVTIDDLKYLLKDKTLILYANDNEHLYGLCISSQNIVLKKIMTLPLFKEKVESWYQYLTREVSKQQEEFLLDTLVPFNREQQAIVIIPDEYTRTVPFAALKNKNGTFAIEEHRFSYDISATFFYNHHTSNQFSISNSSVVMPNYIEEITKRLSFSETEGNSIAKVLGANQVADASANRINLIKLLESNDLVHFTGHLQNENGESSMLLSDNESISIDDIYHSVSNVKFLFMNACESASGKVLVGEGVANFARSFMQAGSETVIQTQWNVNDYSSSVIGVEFYKKLKEGKQVDEAMRLAQLNYLENADDFARHPYYWASIGVIGKTDAIQFESFFNQYFLLFLLVIIMILFLWLISKIRN